MTDYEKALERAREIWVDTDPVLSREVYDSEEVVLLVKALLQADTALKHIAWKNNQKVSELLLDNTVDDDG